ncbi:toxin-antitoxin system YwqK family antitoxin [Cupriavidus sp. H18C2]|uniref:toxin-antitoxin system YwqK family antitoxin n=1 Tax=Cupriavidus sp. H18C2 TaxID=3241602 RepID=UPI003BF8BD56
MKIYRYLTILSVAPVLVVSACGKNEVLDFRNATIVNGKVYAVGANEPFFGALTNVPASVLLTQQQGFRLTSKLAGIALSDALSAGDDNARSVFRESGAGALAYGALCNARIRDGLPDGKAVCKEPQSDIVRMDMSFNEGALDDSLRLYGGQRDSGLIMDVTFQNGQPDGTQQVYSWANHKLIHTFPWDKGVPSGTEDGFDANTGARVKRAKFVNGKYEGEVLHYSPDGKQLTIKATYAQGNLNGPYKEWDANGTLIADKTYANGIEVGPNGSPLEDCVQSWEKAAEAIRSAYATRGLDRGAPALTPADQRPAWEAACREGRHPNPSDAANAEQVASKAEADAKQCVSVKRAAYESSHGERVLTDAQIMEIRDECYSASSATLH